METTGIQFKEWPFLVIKQVQQGASFDFLTFEDLTKEEVESSFLWADNCTATPHMSIQGEAILKTKRISWYTMLQGYIEEQQKWLLIPPNWGASHKWFNISLFSWYPDPRAPAMYDQKMAFLLQQASLNGRFCTGDASLDLVSMAPPLRHNFCCNTMCCGPSYFLRKGCAIASLVGYYLALLLGNNEILYLCDLKYLLFDSLYFLVRPEEILCLAPVIIC